MGTLIAALADFVRLDAEDSIEHKGVQNRDVELPHRGRHVRHRSGDCVRFAQPQKSQWVTALEDDADRSAAVFGYYGAHRIH